MLKAERAAVVLSRLNEIYPETPVPLDHSDSFTLLIAVLLSAQCTDKKVNEVTPELFRLGGTPKEMMQMGPEAILAIIKPLGLSNQKAKNCAKLAEILVKEHNSEVPEEIETLETLPGVGHKTASVVVSQAFGQPAFPVDTHIHRLAQRWGLTNGKNVQTTEKDLKKLFPIDAWNKLHLQIIFYGREHCTARGCDGTTCDMCRELYPRRRKPFITKKA
ncbi:MAG: endonuclease III [Planctomycetota bacterium]